MYNSSGMMLAIVFFTLNWHKHVKLDRGLNIVTSRETYILSIPD